MKENVAGNCLECGKEIHSDEGRFQSSDGSIMLCEKCSKENKGVKLSGDWRAFPEEKSEMAKAIEQENVLEKLMNQVTFHPCEHRQVQNGICLDCMEPMATITVKELENLKRWKEEQLEVERSWDVQAVAEALELPLGTLVRPAILPGIEKLKAEVRRLRTILEEKS